MGRTTLVKNNCDDRQVKSTESLAWITVSYKPNVVGLKEPYRANLQGWKCGCSFRNILPWITFNQGLEGKEVFVILDTWGIVEWNGIQFVFLENLSSIIDAMVLFQQSFPHSTHLEFAKISRFNHCKNKEITC